MLETIFAEVTLNVCDPLAPDVDELDGLALLAVEEPELELDDPIEEAPAAPPVPVSWTSCPT